MDSGTFNLNVFTNVASPDPSDCLAHYAVRSFLSTFPDLGGRKLVTRIYCDPNPNHTGFDAWIDTIRRGLPGVAFEVVQTRGMLDGFIRSLTGSEGAYAMMLEHDFVFRASRISHSLPQMLERMAADEMNYLRFNKRTNLPAAYDYAVLPAGDEQFPMCRVNGRSNNPHLIDVDYYRRMVAPLLSAPGGDMIGLEGGLCRFTGGGFVYGGPGHPRTVQHLDGRRLRFKDAMHRKVFMLKQKRSSREEAVAG